jgi:hypothetical protein
MRIIQNSLRGDGITSHAPGASEGIRMRPTPIVSTEQKICQGQRLMLRFDLNRSIEKQFTEDFF